MSFDLCVEKTAEKPFFIKSVGVRVYSAEELCYFLYHNLYLIDSDVINVRLTGWIRDELDMKTLAKKLNDALERPDNDASYFIMPIFAQTGYLSLEEQHKVREELTRAQVKPEEERSKIRADYLTRGGRYTAAIAQYRSILNNKSNGKLSAQFYANVWNNLGCAYAMLFCFRDAADAFLNGWKLVHSRELMRKYVSALPLYLSEEDYQRKMKSLGADPVLTGMIQEYNLKVAEEVKERVESRINPQADLRGILENLKEEYRRGAYL